MAPDTMRRPDSAFLRRQGLKGVLPILKSASWVAEARLAPGPDIWSAAVTDGIEAVLVQREIEAPTAWLALPRPGAPASLIGRPEMRVLSEEDIRRRLPSGADPMPPALANLRDLLMDRPLDVVNDAVVRFRHWFPAQAGAVLVPEFMEKIFAILGRPVAVGLPNRDSVTFLRAEPRLLARARPIVREQHFESDYPLSENLFIADGARITPIP
ncbi:MAG: hypothetical protein HYY18_14590 [Planctomycetes bacterium]|nr:hypothetical protein [Planctomycetota bacterium]